MRISIVMKELDGEKNLDWFFDNVKNIHVYDDSIEIQNYVNEEYKKLSIISISRIPKKEIQEIEIIEI